jgi:hypothetical protein
MKLTVRVVVAQIISNSKCQVLTEKKLDEINARLEHSPQNFAQETSLKFQVWVFPKRNLLHEGF